MDFLISAMHKGGPFMWPILLFSLVGLVVPVGLGLLSLRGKRVPAVLWVLVPGFRVRTDCVRYRIGSYIADVVP